MRTRNGIPKTLESLFALYPMALLGTVVATAILALRSGSPAAVAVFLFLAFFLSPLLWRVVQAVTGSPVEGNYWIGKRVASGNLWVVSYHLQQFYIAFPVFERALRLVPGLYSAWLRLWGARIGTKVNWTPECQIVDRPLLKVGDRTFFGNRSYISAHAIKKRNGRYFLYVKGVEFADDVFLGYACHVAPGVKVKRAGFIDAGARLYPNTVVEEGEQYVDFVRPVRD